MQGRLMHQGLLRTQFVQRRTHTLRTCACSKRRLTLLTEGCANSEGGTSDAPVPVPPLLLLFFLATTSAYRVGNMEAAGLVGCSCRGCGEDVGCCCCWWLRCVLGCGCWPPLL